MKCKHCGIDTNGTAYCSDCWKDQLTTRVDNVVSLWAHKRKHSQPEAQANVQAWLGKKAKEDDGHSFEREMEMNAAKKRKAAADRKQANVGVLRSYRIK